MRGRRIGFLVLDVTDIEHETQHTLHLSADQRLALNPEPEGFLCGIGLGQTHTQQHGRAFVTQLGQATGQFLAVRRMNQRQPVLTRQAFDPVTQAQAARKLWCQQNLVRAGQQFPPASAQQVLKHRQTLDVMSIVLLRQSEQHRPGQGGTQVQPLPLTQVRRLLCSIVKAEQQPGLGHAFTAVWHQKTVGVGERALQRCGMRARAE